MSSTHARRGQHQEWSAGGFSLDEINVRDWFDRTTFERGDDYERRGKVRDLSLETKDTGLALSASVRGSSGSIYQVDIDLILDRHRLDCDCICSCPVEVDCKHAAATLLHAIRRGSFAGPGSPAAAARPGGAAKAADPLAGPIGAWIERLSAATAPQGASVSPSETLLYCFVVRPDRDGAQRLDLDLIVARPGKTGGWGAAKRTPLNMVAHPFGERFTEADRAIARVLMAASPGEGRSWPRLASQDTLEWAMDKILATGRAHWKSKDGVRMRRGPDRPGRLGWAINPIGHQLPRLTADEDGMIVLPGATPFVLDVSTGDCGRLLLALPNQVLRAILDAPPIPPEAAPALAKAMAERFPDLPISAPRADMTVAVNSSPPVPVLRLASPSVPVEAYLQRSKAREKERIDAAWLSFDYDGVEIAAETPVEDIRRMVGDMITVRKRRVDVEREALSRLAGLGLIKLRSHDDMRVAKVRAGGGLSFPGLDDSRLYRRSIPHDPLAWPVFMHETVPKLAAEGWRIVVEEDFQHRMVDADGDWQAEVEDKGGWWFSLDLGIDVDGERIALLPVLTSVLGRLKPGVPLDSLAPTGTLYSRLPDGRTLALPFERVRRLIEVLVDLFGDRPPGESRTIDLSLAQAMELDAVAEATRLRWVGGQRLRTLAKELRRDGVGEEERKLPAGFTVELRPYQRIGLGWMGFLAGQGLGGVLADDMGLGKTVQTLAHILAEKNSGGMSAPFLVVCPTTLVATWRDEAARFAPELEVLIMHGHDRPRATEALGGVDLVVTTYPLLIRDDALLGSMTWHGIALDEAQAIKNPAARWTQVACRLKAGHRLCLTGTPVENHLGEAWSLFTFLMPGLLSDSKTFARVFRTPIEKKGDADRRQLLSRRLKPFLLRRTKAEVAAELPAKTEIVRRIDLAGDQRDLYETLRLSMDEKVRRAVASKGLGRSSIVILDALLKLRQACCDPRLVKLKAGGKSGRGSAKLDFLMEFVPPLVEEGRRILLFSQFTSMLGLIKAELDKAKIPFVELTGDTVDRDKPVKSFQSGAVPLFLISLKAGGVGLTLTAADTVIHYDPWWNPAVEDQATDRAHRIGQDKPVFVYKLIAAGTVEERMLELQNRKRAFAAALFDPDSKGALSFTEEDLAALFQPIG
jgi:hypothetical protein